jgi:DNA-binding response OmpR family regulator
MQGNAMAVHSDPGTQLFHRRHARQGLRVVVADDDRDTVATLTVILETAGHKVHPVYDGRDVLPTARLVRPDAIILDISVPGMSGYAVAQAIRHSFTEARRPLLIAITGMWKEAPDRLVAQQVGFDHHFIKPCDPREVLALLDSLQQPDRA